MPMSVDHAGHERPAAAINDLRFSRREKSSVASAFIRPPLDEEAKSAFQRARLAVEEEEIRENDGLDRVLRPGARRKAKRGERRAHARDEASPRELAVDPPRD